MARADLSMAGAPAPARATELADMQGLLYTGYGTLPDACFLVLRIADPAAARAWLATAPVATADQRNLQTALQVALTARGMRGLGAPPSLIAQFSQEFVAGMAGDASRSRRLGDIGDSAPNRWLWGAEPPDALVLLYAAKGTLPGLRRQVHTAGFTQAFEVLRVLDTSDMGGLEPFGFVDGVSQPRIDWQAERAPAEDSIRPYGNLISAGEFVLGYPNEYGEYTDRPLLDPADPEAAMLPPAADRPHLRDLGRNGSYLVMRELWQDVRGFWRFMAMQAGDPAGAIGLAEAVVGRRREGVPLERLSAAAIEGVGPGADDDGKNRFTYAGDSAGLRCPVGAHVRRANPRTGDLPGDRRGTFSRLACMLGIGRPDLRDDLIAASRFHRMLRRGREFGERLPPEQAMRPDAPDPAAGLHFICLNANIARQFEFVQNAWLQGSKFAGLDGEADPLTGNRAPLSAGDDGALPTDSFSLPQPSGVRRCLKEIPRFVTLAGGGYFFLPGVRALRYFAGLRPS